MAAPTHVQYAATASNATTPKTAPLTVQAGDVLVVRCVGEDVGLVPAFGTPTNDGAALTWTAAQEAAVASNCWVKAWTAEVDTDRSPITISMSRVGGGGTWWGAARAWRDSGGVGGSAKVEGDTSANFSVDITTLEDDSAIDVVHGDWAAVAGARTYLTATAGAFTENTNLAGGGGGYQIISGYHANAGVAGLKTIGASAPSGQDVSIVVVENLGIGRSGGQYDEGR